MSKGRMIASALLWLALSYSAGGRGDANLTDAGSAAEPPRTQIAEVLYGSSALSRMRMRCREVGEPEHRGKPLARLHCAFATVTIRQQPPERMATLENYAEILKELRAQCKSASPRSERARLACANCRRDLSDECLYTQAMLALRQDCAKTAPPITHANPAVAALERAEAERGQSGAALLRKFCGACTGQPSAQCFSSFWGAIEAPPRCTLAMDAYELELTRQGKTSTWIGNLGGPCNTQISLSSDDRHNVWTYTEVRLTPEPCAHGDSLTQLTSPVTYSSAAQYAFKELPAMCSRLTFL